MSIVESTDEQIRAVADPLWRDLLKHSNEGKYAQFVEKFAKSLALAMNEVVVNHQFANSELARNLSEDADYLGIIRRGEHAPLGLRPIVDEWLGLRGRGVDAMLALFACVLLAGGVYAVASLAG